MKLVEGTFLYRFFNCSLRWILNFFLNLSKINSPNLRLHFNYYACQIVSDCQPIGKLWKSLLTSLGLLCDRESKTFFSRKNSRKWLSTIAIVQIKQGLLTPLSAPFLLKPLKPL